MFKGLGTRIVTALLLAGLLVFAWLDGDIILDVFLLVLCGIGTWEFTRMFLKNRSKIMLYLSIILTVFISIITLFTSITSFVPFIISALIVAIMSLFRWSKQVDKAFEDGAIVIISQLYVPMIVLLAADFSPFEQLFIVALPACSDTFAYFTGLAIGKHKIWPEVSPKKSVEGSIGGFLAAIIFTVLYLGHLGSNPIFDSFAAISDSFNISTVLLFVFVGAILAVLAQLGDFFESGLKRYADIKDSSNILPGHGGILDRLDSIVFVLPAYYVISSFLPHLRF